MTRTLVRLSILILLLIAGNAHAQWVNVTNLTGTTAAYGTYNVTVTSSGLVAMGGSPLCVGAVQYWECTSSGFGQYTFTMSKPIYGIRINCFGLNGGALGSGEYLKVFINGVFYPLTPADILSYNSCLPGGGPSYLWTGLFMGPVGAAFDYNGGTIEIKSCAKIYSFEVYGAGTLNGVSDSIDIDTAGAMALSNNPCVGDTLQLNIQEDTASSAYSWTGPGGFVSTLKSPFIYPAVPADSGLYICVRTTTCGLDTDSVVVTVHRLPVINISNNSPVCPGASDTLKLFAGVASVPLGTIFAWTGPASFSDATENPVRPGVVPADSGIYKVVVTSPFGCSDSAYTHVSLATPPPAPGLTGYTPYCQGMPFKPFVVTGLAAGCTIEWYTVGSGGIASTTPITVNTSVPGNTTVWISQRIGSCEGGRDSFTTHVIATPPAPAISGTEEYCQYVGKFVPLKISSGSDTVLWYTSATGGVGSFAEPIPNMSVAGTDNYWVSLRDSTCEGARTPVSITIHPKPAPPVVKPHPYCQYAPSSPIDVTASGAGDLLTYFGLGMPLAGSSSVPTPPTIIPGVDTYYIDEISIYGCVSDSAIDTVRIIPKPGNPVTRDTMYCQGTLGAPLTADSTIGSRLNWYSAGVKLQGAPIPSNSVPGDSTWYVSQTINACEGDSVAIKVTTIYTPVFSIAASSPWVCQFDSLSFAYNGPALYQPAYVWSIPGDGGAHFAHLPNQPVSQPNDSMIDVRFDSVTMDNYIHLRVTDNNGFCGSDTSIRITVIPMPAATSFSKTDVCLGDTVTLKLSSKTPEASIFTWLVDNVPMGNSSALNIIASSSNSGGPFSITWNDSGRHVIQLNTKTLEGCRSLPSYDSINVHTLPNASFTYKLSPGSLCIEDSVLFSANDSNYNYSFNWAPAHSFDNANKPTAWGRVEQAQSVITLTVTDPFGCVATQSEELDPGTCCTVLFPNAFTPNGDHKNDVFRPIFSGYHRFHVFRIANRWGQTVFETTNSTVEWDGNFNGVPQDMGVYYYYIKYDCGGNTIEQTGDVTLVK